MSPAGRRRVLQGIVGCSGALLACGPPPPPPAPVLRVPLGELAAGARLRLVFEGEPLELMRTATGVRARSLSCTHFGCEVRWSPAKELYLCPCHAGQFDPDGHPVGGPPTQPLPALAAAIEGGEVVVRRP